MYEESKIEFDWKGFLIKLAIIIVIIILIIKLLPLENKNTSKNLSAEFNSNMSTLREGSSEYFVSDRLPNVGESREVSLEDLINVGAVRNLTDGAGASCDVKNSYVNVSNKTHNHELEIHLICGKEVDTVYVYFPKSDVANDGDEAPVDEDKTNSTTTKVINTTKSNKTGSNGGDVATTQKVVTSKIVKTTKPASHVSIIFNSNGGTTVSTQSVKIGSTPIKPINPVKVGYVFVGWFDTSNKVYNFNLPVNNTIILKAKWSLKGNALPVVTTTKASPTTIRKIANQYVVTFNSNGGTSKPSKTVNSGSYVSKPSNPIRSNAEFIGWYLGDNLFNFNSRITRNITLVARYNVTETRTTSALSIGWGKPSSTFNVSHTLAIPSELKHSSYKNVRIDSLYFVRSLYSSTDISNYYRYWDSTFVGTASNYDYTSGKPENFVYFKDKSVSIINPSGRNVSWSGTVERTCTPFNYLDVNACLYGIKYNIVWKYEVFR